MKLFSFHAQLVADFLAHDQDNDFLSFDIVQCTQVARPELELSKRFGRSRLMAFVGVVGWFTRRARIAASRIRRSRFGKVRSCRSASSVMVLR
jgi:hypothetical protein